MNFYLQTRSKLIFPMLILFLFAAITLFSTGCTSKPEEAKGELIKSPEEIAQEQEEQARLERESLILERQQREEQLKEKLGPFFVPLPPLEQEENPPVKARGIYLTGNTVGRPERFAQLIDMVETTELNAMVIDVKNDHGVMSYRSGIQIVEDVKANRNVPIRDIRAVLEDLKNRGIYTIARVVVFKDPNLPEQRPEWAIQSKNGGIWRDNKGVAWVNPYNQEVWEYNIAIAKEAALMGFQEIQFDYIRFPENAARVDREADFPGQNGRPRDQAIEEFLIYAQERLAEYNVHIAADTFGVIATSWGDSDRIGQTWEKFAANVGYNCPMIYPSHYGPGYFGFAVPDAVPGPTITRALTDSIKRNAPIENPAIIRPWLQSFTASWVRGNIPYGAKEVRAQIDAGLALGIDEYLIWNANNRYIKEAFLTQEEFDQRAEQFRLAREEKGQDVIGKTANQALEEFLRAIQRKNWREALVLHSTGFTVAYDGYRGWMESWAGNLSRYEVKGSSQNGDRFNFAVDVTVKVNGEDKELTDQEFIVFIENHIWRVKPSGEFMDSLVKQEAVTESQEDAENSEENPAN